MNKAGEYRIRTNVIDALRSTLEGVSPARDDPGFRPGEGKRNIPAHYGDLGDSFMGRMVSKYAIEGGKATGKPNG